jgi:hypothetical protein
MTDTSSANHHPELPPELLTALQEFDAWSQTQLLLEQNESTPTEPLYHYTIEEAFRGCRLSTAIQSSNLNHGGRCRRLFAFTQSKFQ